MALPDSLTVERLAAIIDRDIDLDGEGLDGDLLEMYLQAAFEQAQSPPPWGSGRALSPTPPLSGSNDDGQPTTKRILLRGRRHVLIPDARTITEVKVDGVATTAYETSIHKGLITCIDLADRCGTVLEVTGRWGYAELPVQLQDAIYALAARAYIEKAIGFADEARIAEGAGPQVFRQLPPRVKLAFSSFVVPMGYVGLG